MPAFFDPHTQIPAAINSQLLPALDDLAADPDRLERALNRRFGREVPPQDDDETESDIEQEARDFELSQRPREAILSEYRDLIDAPLDGDDVDNLAFQFHHSHHLYDPRKRYEDESNHEQGLLLDFYRSKWPDPRTERFLEGGEKGELRRKIIARHIVKKRWQNLGLWNTKWGIPGRLNRQENDNVVRWRWAFEPEPLEFGPDHPATLATHRSKGRKFGEHQNPPPPHANPGSSKCASQHEARDFIITRPWFLWAQEKMEYNHRLERIPLAFLGRCREDEPDTVKELWKKRGHWDDNWEQHTTYVGRPVPGWRWPNEDSDLEPDDSYDLDTELTPSEVDALEDVDALPQPRPVEFFPQPPTGLTVPLGSLFPIQTYTPPPKKRQRKSTGTKQEGQGSTEKRRGRPPKSANRVEMPKQNSSVQQRLPRAKHRPQKNTVDNWAEQPRRSARIAAHSAAPSEPEPASFPCQPLKKPLQSNSTKTGGRKPRPLPARAPAPEGPKRARGRPARETSSTESKPRGRPSKVVASNGVEKPKSPPARHGRKPKALVEVAVASTIKGTATAPAHGRGRPRKSG
ncbi:hypothetical protein MCOR27_000627 [Pyricularia oryzae]|nr:hypothetical protein MCOR02_003809 [Pyricularia oryzae]KAI6270532.1 hypothetical protein MCOR26_008197 [Pyricularia oryzae]KAI6288805.1 hypothetical protein MCOR27_000627 [Pyricularia oryzae]KAI6336857.1 hypothetical protein MCOR30_003539 [Pyricularia oryzae]KAI6340542.1 hypothetical protein MCOR28_006516 [Pyricularia oryzae]